MNKVRKMFSDITENGLELPDSVPLEIGLDLKTETLADQIRRILRTEINQYAMKSGYETFEEAEDFDVEDEEPLPLSDYEAILMKEEIYNNLEPSESAPAEPAADEAAKNESEVTDES